MMSLEFFIDVFLPIALWPWVRLSLYQEWVSEEFPGGKGGRCVGLTTLPHSCVPLSWNLRTLTSWKPLGYSRPVKGLIYVIYYKFKRIVLWYYIKQSVRLYKCMDVNIREDSNYKNCIYFLIAVSFHIQYVLYWKNWREISLWAPEPMPGLSAFHMTCKQAND